MCHQSVIQNLKYMGLCPHLLSRVSQMPVISWGIQGLNCTGSLLFVTGCFTFLFFLLSFLAYAKGATSGKFVRRGAGINFEVREKGKERGWMLGGLLINNNAISPVYCVINPVWEHTGSRLGSLPGCWRCVCCPKSTGSIPVPAPRPFALVPSVSPLLCDQDPP